MTDADFTPEGRIPEPRHGRPGSAPAPGKITPAPRRPTVRRRRAVRVPDGAIEVPAFGPADRDAELRDGPAPTPAPRFTGTVRPEEDDGSGTTGTAGANGRTGAADRPRTSRRVMAALWITILLLILVTVFLLLTTTGDAAPLAAVTDALTGHLTATSSPPLGVS